MLKALILDFDGVVIDSIDVKTEAFKVLFRNYPEHLNAIIDYHLRHGGVSRYRKFIHIYEKILEQSLEEEKLRELGDKFSQLVVEKVMQCPYISGAIDFLEEYSKKLRLYIASGTPREELQKIIRSRKLSKYFKGVYGTPALKSKIIDKILSENKLKKNEVLFIGDSVTDYEEAKKAKIPFVGFLRDKSSINPFSDAQTPVVQSFDELRRLLQETCFHGN